MEMEFSVVHGGYPLWLRVAITATGAFALAAFWLVRRARYPIVTCTVPLFGNVTASFIGLARVSEGMSLVGGGRHAAAAGCAEAQAPLLFGAGVTLLIAVVFTVRPVPIPAWKGKEQRLVVAVAAMLIALLVADVAISLWLVAPGRHSIEPAATGAYTVFYVALIAFVAACALAAPRRSTCERSAPGTRVPFVLVGTAAAVLFVTMRIFTSSLQNIALGR